MTTTTDMSKPGAAPESPQFLGHPRGLFVLFFAEMWERFSYYGMRAILVFYLLQHWLFSEDKAYLIYGAYTALVYITPVIGGYLADRYIGQRKAVQYGAVLLVIGHSLMAFEGSGGQDSPYLNLFWLALAFIIMGVGFLKANISAIVGQLYRQGDARRDPAFTIFYMGINVGAFLGALIVGYLGEVYGWSWGFGAAGVGMLLGLIVFVWGRPTLLGHGEPADPQRLQQRVAGITTEWWIYLWGIVGVAIVWALVQFQSVIGWLLGLSGIVVVGYLLITAVAKMDKIHRDRILAALFLIGLQPLFWALFEQAGSSLNVYTQEQVNRIVFGWEVPASMFQSINAFFIITLGPIFAWLWLWLARRGMEPSTPAKFGLGLIQLGAGFLVLVLGAASVGSGQLTPLVFIFLIYMLHTMGELCLSPVGLSAMTKLAPLKMVSLLMGTWFLASAAGNYIAGLVARATGSEPGAGAAATPVMDVYHIIGWVAVAVGVGVILVSPWIKRLMHEDIDDEGGHDHRLAGQSEIGEPASAGTRIDDERYP